MSAKIRAAGVALATAIGLSPVAAQDAPPHSWSQQLKAAKAVELEISGVNEEGISDVSVNLTDLDSQRGVKTAFTDSSGHVRFDGQLDGRYQLDISGPGVEDHGWVVSVTPGRRSFALRLLVIDGKPVKAHFEPSYVLSNGPLNVAQPVETEMSMSEDKLVPPVPPPPLPVVSLIPSRAQRRNPIARFFSAIGRQLGF